MMEEQPRIQPHVLELEANDIELLKQGKIEITVLEDNCVDILGIKHLNDV